MRIIPPVIVTDVDPKLAVHRSNNQNRDATPGQKAMATAMAFPETQRGKRNDLLLEATSGVDKGYDKSTLSRARYVLRNNPIADGKSYPDRQAAEKTHRYLFKATKVVTIPPMKNLHVPLDPELHRHLKILAAARGTTVAAIVRAALADTLPPMPLEIPAGVLNRRRQPINPTLESR